MKRRIRKNDLTAWFLEDHATLPASYVKSCEEFFEELGRQRGKLQATSDKRQAGYPEDPAEWESQEDIKKRCNLFTTMLNNKTESENKK